MSKYTKSIVIRLVAVGITGSIVLVLVNLDRFHPENIFKDPLAEVILLASIFLFAVTFVAYFEWPYPGPKNPVTNPRIIKTRKL